MHDDITVEVDQAVAVVTLDAPARRNALTAAMASELTQAFREVDGRRDVGALVVRATGASFCAGADVTALARAAQDPAAPADYQVISDIYAAFENLGRVGVPTIAAVQGSAVGAGLNLALAADLRVVAHDVRLLSGFLRRGLHPGGGHFVLLSRAVGREAAAAMALMGEEIDGRRAVQLGMAWESVDADQVHARAFELAVRVAADPDLARATVRNFRRETGPPHLDWGTAVQVERATQMWSMRRQD